MLMGSRSTAPPSGLAAPRPIMLLMTGYAEGSAYAEFLQATEAPVRLKPIGIDELRERVRAMLEER